MEQWHKWTPLSHGKPTFPGWKIRRGYRNKATPPKLKTSADGEFSVAVENWGDDVVEVLLRAERRVYSRPGAPLWRIDGVFPFPREKLKDPRVEEVLRKALLEAIAKGPN
jgi:hypothetical protein